MLAIMRSLPCPNRQEEVFLEQAIHFPPADGQKTQGDNMKSLQWVQRFETVTLLTLVALARNSSAARK